MKKYQTTPVHLYIIILFIFWSLVITGLANWKIDNNAGTIRELAENEARANFNKEKALRLWMTSHGRVYVPVGERYQPDTYLEHISTLR